VPSRSKVVVELRTRDAERTRESIRRAALAEFAERGLGGARMDSIAGRAGIDKKLIYYYFGSKEGLFLAALELTYADIRAAEAGLQLDELDPVEAIRRLVTFTWNHFIAHPEFLALLNSENLHRAQHLKRSLQIREMNSPIVRMLDDLLERGRRTGVFRGGVDPLQLYITIAALPFFYISNSATLSTVFGRDLMTPKAQAERLSHTIDVVLGYLLRD
jgi:AcrR family transcriptional regulator